MRDFDRAARGKGGADAVVALTGPEINMFNDNYRFLRTMKMSEIILSGPMQRFKGYL